MAQRRMGMAAAAITLMVAAAGARAQEKGFFAPLRKAAEVGGYCFMDLEYPIDAPQLSTITYGSIACAPTAEKAMAAILERATSPGACEVRADLRPRRLASGGTCRATIVHPVGDPSSPQIRFAEPACRPGAAIAMTTLVAFLLAHPIAPQ